MYKILFVLISVFGCAITLTLVNPFADSTRVPVVYPTVTPRPTPTHTPVVFFFFVPVETMEVFAPYPTQSRYALVCKTDKLGVYGGPLYTKAIRTLNAGEKVFVWEMDKRGLGWAMIETAEWVDAAFLCFI